MKIKQAYAVRAACTDKLLGKFTVRGSSFDLLHARANARVKAMERSAKYALDVDINVVPVGKFEIV